MSEFRKTTKSPVRTIFLSVLTGFIAFTLLTSLISIIMLNIHIENKYLYLLNYIILSLCILFSAMITANKSINKRLLNGFITGIILISIILLVYLSFNKYISFSLIIKSFILKLLFFKNTKLYWHFYYNIINDYL